MATASGWLVLTAAWWNHGDPPRLRGMRIDRLTKKRPDLKADEIACRITVRVPDRVFTKPAFEVSIDVPEEALVHPEVIESTVEVPDPGGIT